MQLCREGGTIYQCLYLDIYCCYYYRTQPINKITYFRESLNSFTQFTIRKLLVQVQTFKTVALTFTRSLAPLS